MLTENDVVAAVCTHLESEGYTITARAHTTERGPDITARHPERGELLVEAKGATSARAGSARFGKPFESAAVRVHVAEAFYTAAGAAGGATTAQAALALPDNPHHRRYLKPLKPAIDVLGIQVFWVDEDANVKPGP